MTDTPEMVERAGVAVLAELVDRKGFRQVIGTIDPNIVAELEAAIGRAAIEAMREPTEAMSDAAAHGGNKFGFPSCDETWRAMIDDALK